ncbi:MAG: hypothetical protein K0S04_163 [Herbinix sp.]|jgi:hypothetical protein|nr:hypothetical protein [Herbinix sp.]
MNEKMKSHIEKLFESAPKTRKAFELKEELLVNSEERYQDLLTNGVNPEDAFKNVVSSIGNVSELFLGLEEMSPEGREEQESRTRKIAVVKTAAAGLYILSVIVFITLTLVDGFTYSNVNITSLGLILMLLLAMIPTCMLVYISSMHPKYRRTEDTVVEEFKEWKSSTVKTKSVKSATICVAWTFIILIYFVVSFATFAWYASWIIFLAGACVHAILELVFRLKELRQ